MKDAEYLPGTEPTWLKSRQAVYLVAGDDDESVREASRLIVDSLLEGDAADFDFDTLDATSSDIRDIAGSVQREPLIGEVRVVLVEGCEALRKREFAKTAEQLEQLIRHMPARSALILAARTEATRDRAARVLLTPKLDAAVRAQGLIVRCPLLVGDALVGWMAAYARSAGKQITREAARRLMRRELVDRMTMSRELDKVIAYVGERPRIQLEDVESVACHDPEDVIFDLVGAISARQTSRALVLLRRASQYETKPQALAGKLLALLNRQLRLLYQARELQAMRVPPYDLGRMPEDLQKELPAEASVLSLPWKAKSLWSDAGKWSREELIQAFEWLAECDAANKGDEAWFEDPLANLEYLVLILCDPTLARTVKDASLHGEVQGCLSSVKTSTG